MKKRSLIFQTSTFPRKPGGGSESKSKTSGPSSLGLKESGIARKEVGGGITSSQARKSPVMTKSENKKNREGGGIPRPQLGITTSPSKLAVRTNTSKLVNINPNTNPNLNMNPNINVNSKHETVVRSSSGGEKLSVQTQSGDTGPYKLLPSSLVQPGGRALVNDKLYPRIPHPGPPLFHPSAPQRSQTLSMIPSHASRTKMGAGAVPSVKVPNMPPQVRFGPPPPASESQHLSRLPSVLAGPPLHPASQQKVLQSGTPVPFSVPSSSYPKTVPSYPPHSVQGQQNYGPQTGHQGQAKSHISHHRLLPGPGQSQRAQTPASFSAPHPTPPPYHQPPQPPQPPPPAETSRHNESDDPAPASQQTEAKSEVRRDTAAITDLNKKVGDLQTEVRSLKDLNARLSEDNKELRDLCCFLDDDRQKGRKLAREWQRFGRYTASVMRQEVSNYQTKLKDLAGKQEELIRDNLELKELCLYLDEERAGTVTVCTDCGGPCPPPHPTIQAVRDEGDGSSSSTNNDETETSASNLLEELNAINAREKLYLKGNKMGLNDEILAYIRNLEDRVKLLEAGSEYPLSKHFTIEQITEEQDQGNRPASVTNAMKVLEVHEQILEKSLDSDETSDDLCDGEKALVREMCNVVWRKLEDN